MSGEAVYDAWIAHHYSHHGGELDECTSRTCVLVVEWLTRPEVMS